MIDPVTGMMILGGAQLGGNLINSLLGAGASRDSAEAQQRALAQQLAERKNAYKDVTGLYSPEMRMGGVALRDLNQMAYQDIPSQQDFQYGKTIDDFLDPSMAFQQEQMRRNVDQSAVSGGGLYSGNTLKELQDRGAQLAQTDYANAFNRMDKDKSNAYTEFLNKFNSERSATADRWSRLSAIAGMGQNAKGVTAGARTGLSNQTSDILGQQGNLQGFQATIPYSLGSDITNSLTDPKFLNATMGYFNQQQPQQQQPQQNPYMSGLDPSLMNQMGGVKQGNLGGF